MAEYVAVLPAIHHADTMRCVESLDRWQISADHLMVIDNGAQLDCDEIDHLVRWHVAYDGTNRGVPASWNIGIDLARERDVDYLILLSHSIEFGDLRGLDLLDELDRSPAHGCGTQFGWKCIAIGRPCWETIGRFDEVFTPAYFEDTDYLYRLGLAGMPSPRENGGVWPQFMVDAVSHGDAFTLQRGLIDHRVYARSQAAYGRKWGGPQGAETFERPYNDPTLDFTFTGEHP